MTSIDPIRLTTIISSLALERKSTRGSRKQKLNGVLDKDLTNDDKDQELLKQKIRQLGINLKKQGAEHYEKEAPKALIQAVILWEFGEEFINHPDYRQISDFVTQSISANKQLREQLHKLISQLESDN